MGLSTENFLLADVWDVSFEEASVFEEYPDREYVVLVIYVLGSAARTKGRWY